MSNAVLGRARNQRPFGVGGARRSRVVRLLTAVLAVVVAWSGLAWVTAAPAAADPTGTGGQFVPLQSRLIDTRSGTGGFTGKLPVDTWVTFTASGQAGLPSTGVAAVVATVTALNDPGTTSGVMMAGPNSGGSAVPVVAVIYDVNEIVSNTVVIENGDDGKIKLKSERNIHVVVDIQGYFTTGNGTPAPGGFVSLPAANVTTISAPAAGSTSTVQVTGVAGVPATATAVYANLLVDNTAAGSGTGGCCRTRPGRPHRTRHR